MPRLCRCPLTQPLVFVRFRPVGAIAGHSLSVGVEVTKVEDVVRGVECKVAIVLLLGGVTRLGHSPVLVRRRARGRSLVRGEAATKPLDTVRQQKERGNIR